MNINYSVKTSLDKLKSIKQQVDQIPQDAYDYFVSITPKDTGNARRNTSLKGKTIEGNYAYAKRLDTGWSNQAPDGMIAPTQKFIEKRVKQIKGK
jgi:hypothetical protein